MKSHTGHLHNQIRSDQIRDHALSAPPRLALRHNPPGSRLSLSTLISFCRRNFSSCSCWMYASARVSTSDLFWNCTPPSFRLVLMPLLALAELVLLLFVRSRRLGMALLSAWNLAFRFERYRFSTALWAALRLLLAATSLLLGSSEDIREGFLVFVVVTFCLGEDEEEVSSTGGGSGSASDMDDGLETIAWVLVPVLGEFLETCSGVVPSDAILAGDDR